MNAPFAPEPEGWIPIATASPPVGERVWCAHERSAPAYNCLGHIDANGEWHCANGFILPRGRFGMLTFTPTHWRPHL